MNEKTLKDLEIGDRVWIYDFTETAPIVVIKKKRIGELVTITLKWNGYKYECFGPALGWTCVGYNRGFGKEIMFTSSYNMASEREDRIKRIVHFIEKRVKRYFKRHSCHSIDSQNN